MQGPRNNFFFFENALKKTTGYLLKFLFLFESKIIDNENNFIQMAASAGHVVAYTVGLIFKHIINYVQLYFTKSFTNILL